MKHAPLVAALILVGCSGGVEQAVLGRFFAAARLRDRTALGAMAVVDFNPGTSGIVRTFHVTAVGHDDRTPLAAARPDVVRLSLAQLARVPIPSNPAGNIVRRRFTLTAQVRVPSGEIVTKAYAATLSRVELAGNKEGNEAGATGAWVVTDLSELTSPPFAPR